MCYVIITCRSMLWTLMSIASFMMLLAAVTSPHWLIGFPRRRGLSALSAANLTIADEGASEEGEEEYNPTLGVFNRCLKLMQVGLSLYGHHDGFTDDGGDDGDDNDEGGGGVMMMMMMMMRRRRRRRRRGMRRRMMMMMMMMMITTTPATMITT
jgi:hypothetical protein